MAIPVLIIGKSGSGKTTSLRTCVGKDFNIIKVLDKPLPFKGKIPACVTDDYQTVMRQLIACKAKSIVIDDAGYLITNQFMRGHSATGAGNAVFEFYNKVADNFWALIDFIIKRVNPNKIVYVIMHEEATDSGEIKPKTIGKLLDEKVNVPGMFTIVLRCIEESGKHLFVTQAANGAVSKSPMGMFDDLVIDNDLYLVDTTIRNYYEIQTEEGDTNNAKTE